MTYLELVRRLAAEVGATGTIQTVVGAVGETARLANWINQAWLELQLSKDSWSWRAIEFEVPITAGTNVVDLKATFPRFQRLLDSELYVRIGDVWSSLAFVPFKDWQDSVRTSATVTSGTPLVYTVLPSTYIELWPVSDRDTRLRGVYVTTPQTLVADADVPELPAEYHTILVYKAMILYAGYEAATEILSIALQGYNRMLSLLQNAELPDIAAPLPMA